MRNVKCGVRRDVKCGVRRNVKCGVRRNVKCGVRRDVKCGVRRDVMCKELTVWKGRVGGLLGRPRLQTASQARHDWVISSGLDPPYPLNAPPSHVPSRPAPPHLILLSADPLPLSSLPHPFHFVQCHSASCPAIPAPTPFVPYPSFFS
ncbi:hypothetical protein Pcinc_036497 [Petrolisthes cinctipes]|uniref:Uncharacterized protein n=1 Tax=Petrolisthes cinctipes TaxID=88211 RepID=A0AAE1BW14_PETCI|nr:hypothetical protein Pcinc_036497 [Petrolisthes cinctipes]